MLSQGLWVEMFISFEDIRSLSAASFSAALLGHAPSGTPYESQRCHRQHHPSMGGAAGAMPGAGPQRETD